MSYIINPLDYNIDTNSRLVIYNLSEKKVHKIYYLENKDKLKLEDEEVNNFIDNYKFKFQINLDKKWHDKTKYFMLVKKDDLGNYLTDKINLSKEKLFNLIYYFSNVKNESNYVYLRKTYKRVCEDLWVNHNSQHKNIKEYLRYIETQNYNFTDLWMNLNLYIDSIYNLKMKYRELDIHRSFYDELTHHLMIESNAPLYKYIIEEIERLKGNHLQFSYILCGMYYSLIGKRTEASEQFSIMKEYNNNYEIHFSIGQGVHTYNQVDNNNNNKSYHDISFFTESNNRNMKETIVISVDVRYLRIYGLQIISNITALRNYHFHIHVIGNIVDVAKVIVETEILFKQILSYSQKENKVIFPTFSYEEIPDYIRSAETLSACARFIHANKFMEKFNSNLIILDADMFITDDLKRYINRFEHFDLGISISRGITSIMPWRRFMAGNVFIRNNVHGRKFMELVGNYILGNLDQDKSWTLDQNALTFAYDKILGIYPNIKIENNYKITRPFSHPPIRNLIEKN